MKFEKLQEAFPGEQKLTYRQRQRWFSRYRRNLLANQTPAEIQFCHLLFELGLRYIPQKGVMMPPRFAIVDFYLPKPHKLCIEIDGSGHRARLQAHKDNVRDAYLRRKGYRVLRFRNDDVLNQGEWVKSRLKELTSQLD